MADLFVETDRSNMTKMQHLLSCIFGDGEEAWKQREAEASAFLSKYIEAHPDMLDKAVIKISGIKRKVQLRMEELRDNYLAEKKDEDPETQAENDFWYARDILILRWLAWLLDERIDGGDDFCHLCDKGCEAIIKMRGCE